MCDETTFEEMEEYLRSRGKLTRRGFNAMMIGAGVMASLPAAANALEVTGSMVRIRTHDGTAEAYFTHPATGRHPGVLVWPDAFGLRPAFQQMARRLAESGYAVLVPNAYYRSTPYPAFPGPIRRDDPKVWERWRQLRAPLTHQAVTRDANTFLDYLDAHKAADRKRPIGTTGYCMGGPMTLLTAAARPARIRAGASFHGAGLVTDKPDSPHLLVSKIKARYLFAIAESDDKKQPEAQDVLRKAFADAHLPAEIEVYPGTQHGWCPPDMPVYNEEQAERAWGRLLVTFGEALA